MIFLGVVDEASDVVNRDYLDKTSMIRYKNANESVATSTTLQDDDDLLFTTLEISTYYALDGILFVTGTTTGDFKYNWNIPTGATLKVFGWGCPSGTATLFGQSPTYAPSDGSSDITFGCATGTAGVVIRGYLLMGGNTGTFGLKWAQGASSTATTVLKGSFLRMRKVV